METFNRITQEPGNMGGKACIRGMRVIGRYDCGADRGRSIRLNIC